MPTGHSIRAPRPDDLPAITALVRACDVAEYGRPDFSEEDLRWEWGWPRFELDRDAWVAIAPDGAVIGYASVWERRPGAEFDGRWFLHPERGPSDAGEALLSLMEERVRAAAGARTETPGARNEPAGARTEPADAAQGPPAPASDRSSAAREALHGPPDLVIPCPSVNAAKRDLLLARGFAPVRSFYRMEIDLSLGFAQADWPEGFEARPMRRGSDDATVHQVLQEAFADHFRFTPEPLEEWTRRTLDHEHFAPHLSAIVRHLDRPVAATTNSLPPDLGWVGMLGVRRPWRGRGLGMALLLASFAAFRGAGCGRVGLGVDSDNADGAVRLYERAGMQVTQRHDLLVKRFPPFSSESR